MGEKTSKRQWVLAVAGVLMIGTAAWMVFGRRAAAPAVAAMPARSSAERVSLWVQHDGPALRLRWNGQSEAVQRASGGALMISEGARQSRLELGSAELRAGAASYWPESQQGVHFQLLLDGAVAGELQAPALAVRQEEPRPSPFENVSKPKRAAKRAAAVEDPDDEMPKPRTVRAADAPPAQHADRADGTADAAEEKPAKPSKWRKVTGKIPLLRRLGRH